MKRRIRQVLAVITACFLMCLFPVSLKAESSGEKTLTSVYYSVTVKDAVTLEVPYDDSWFLSSAHTYNHSLARSSLGLMSACFRPGKTEPEAEGNHAARAEDFLNQAGFEDLRTDDYNRPLGQYTLSSIIGRKVLKDENGEPFTLLAVGICGQGYMDEWMSNLTIGDSEIHEGFNDAASDMFDRIFGYLAEHQIKGRIKIWTSGFSRSAAVANLLSMMLIKSGQIASEDLFAYLYATPRNTRLHTEGDYPGIFNMVGMTDPVPQVPFLDWGYDRYGITFYLPAQETDSTYASLLSGTKEFYKKLTGVEYRNNPEMNARVKMLLEYAGTICPDPTVYKYHLQPILLEFWSNKSPINLLGKVLQIANDPVLITPENQNEANGFLDFLCAMVYDYATESDEFSAFEKQTSTTVEMMKEHTPDIYISWMMAHDNPEQLFSAQNEYTRVVISGNADISILDSSTKDVIQSIDSEGNISHYSDDTQLFAMRQETQTILIIPKDRGYTLSIHCTEPETLKMIQIHYRSEKPHSTEYRSGSCSARKDDIITLNLYPYNVQEDDLDLVTDREETSQLRTDYGGSITSILQFERLNLFRLNWRTNVLFLIGITTFAAAFFAFQIVYMVARLQFFRNRSRNLIPSGSVFKGAPLFALCMVYPLFFLNELTTELYIDSVWTRTIFKCVIGLLLLYVAETGCRMRPSKLHYWVRNGLCAEMLANLMMDFNPYIGALLHCAALLLYMWAFIQFDRPAPWQWAAAAVFIIQGNRMVYGLLSQNYRLEICLLSCLYLSCAVLMFMCSLTVPNLFRMGSFMMVLAGITMTLFFTSRDSFLSHMIALSIYYTGLVMIAAGTIKIPKFAMIPVKPEEKSAAV